MINKFNVDNPQGFDLCPSCCAMPEVQGPTKNCLDPEGCGMFSTSFFIADEDEEYNEDENEDDLEELNFE